MMIDERKHVKSVAIQQIVKSSNNNKRGRNFNALTALNLGAKYYCELTKLGD